MNGSLCERRSQLDDLEGDAKLFNVPVSFLTLVCRFVNDEDHAMAALGPVGGIPEYDWIRNRSISRP